MYVDVEIPAGIFANGTARQARGRWRLSNLVRSPNGTDLQPIPGWVSRSGSGGATGTPFTAVLLTDSASVAWAITVEPVTGNIIATSGASGGVNPHGPFANVLLLDSTDAIWQLTVEAITGNLIVTSVATMGGVASLLLVDSADVLWNLTVEAVTGNLIATPAAASTGVTGSARAILCWTQDDGTRGLAIGTHSHLYFQSTSGALSDITPAGFTAGRADAGAEGGFGSGAYGTGAYGVARPDAEDIQPATVWTLDTFGQFLIGCTAADGKLYEWMLNTSSPAALVTNAPTGIVGATVTQEDFVFVYSGRRIAWCDQADITDWTPSSTNQAGDINLNSEGTFQFGLKVLGGHLHFSQVDVWGSTYQGLPTVYGFQKIGRGAPVSLGAAVAIDSRAVWMGRDSFFMYNGVINPMASEVGDYVFKDFNSEQASKVTSFHFIDHGEVWWLYPSGSSTEIDSYVFWSYRLDHWYAGQLKRTCAAGPGTFNQPIMVDPEGAIWQHETGYNYTGASSPTIRSAPFELPSASGLGQGDDRIQVNGFIGDEATQGDVEITYFTREFPNGPESAFGPFPITSAPVDVMFTGRQVEAEIAFVGADAARVGIFRLDVLPISKR